MAKKMLIDATHAEETRVVVVDGNKVEEFDFESENKRQLAGNIYLAKVTRVEPSLQAAFVEYGGNRHGFLAFSEIHPDYYQIPVADREALLAEERAYAEAAGKRKRTSPSRARAAARGVDAGPRPRRSRPMTRSRPRTSTATTFPEWVSSSWATKTPGRASGRHVAGRLRAGNAGRNAGAPTPSEADDAGGRGTSRPTTPTATTRQTMRCQRPRRRDRIRRRRRRGRGNPPAAQAAAAALQDPGSHQGPPDPAGAGRQGRTRQQGRGADHLPVAGRSLLRPDAQHRARRRHLPQDHQCGRPQEAQRDRGRDRRAARARA